MNARDILAAARVRVIQKHPYITAAVFILRIIEARGIKTLGVDSGARLYYDPDQVERWGTEVTAAVVFHEVNHLIRDHEGRMGGRNPVLWNLAGDAEINDDVIKAGWKLPDGPFLPSSLGMEDGKTAEEYYGAIQAKQPPPPPPQSGGQSKDGDSPPKRGPGKGQCGGCAGNPGPEGDSGKDKSKDQKDQKSEAEAPPPPVSPAELQILRKQVADAVTQASKTRGDIPGGMKLWAEQQLEPPVIPWQKILARHVRRAITDVAGASDYTFKRLARSYWARRRIMGAGTPLSRGLHTPVPQVAMVVDSSGSMSGAPFERALAETLGVVKAIGCPAKTFATDAAVAAVERVASKRDIAKVAVGGGGTDMRVGIEAAAKDKPDVIVVLTDGYTPWPEPKDMPQARVIVGLIGNTIGSLPEHLKPHAVEIKEDE